MSLFTDRIFWVCDKKVVSTFTVISSDRAWGVRISAFDCAPHFAAGSDLYLISENDKDHVVAGSFKSKLQAAAGHSLLHPMVADMQRKQIRTGFRNK
jgi:hypothetical protein